MEEDAQKNPGGRPQAQPEQDPSRLTMGMAAAGLKQKTIAQILGVSVDTLQRRYLTEYHLGQAQQALTVGRLINERMKKSDAVLIFAAKNILGWTDRHVITDRPPDELPYDELSTHELERIVSAYLVQQDSRQGGASGNKSVSEAPGPKESYPIY